MSNLFSSIAENLLYVCGFAIIIIAMFLLAYFVEKAAKKRNGDTERILTTRKIAVSGMFSAIAAVLMIFEVPIFFAPAFLKIDFSELPILIGSFAFGPVAGVFMEFVKVLLKLFIKGTSTAFVGDLGNFIIGCSFILPASIYYLFNKSKKGARISCLLGTIIRTVFASIFNAVYLIPAFAVIYGMPLDVILAMGTEVNPLVSGNSMLSFVIFCVAPVNLIKGGVCAVITLLVYKKISPILKANHKVTVKQVKPAE